MSITYPMNQSTVSLRYSGNLSRFVVAVSQSSTCYLVGIQSLWFSFRLTLSGMTVDCGGFLYRWYNSSGEKGKKWYNSWPQHQQSLVGLCCVFVWWKEERAGRKSKWREGRKTQRVEKTHTLALGMREKWEAGAERRKRETSLTLSFHQLLFSNISMLYFLLNPFQPRDQHSFTQ